jgi:hypothetical protein
MLVSRVALYLLVSSVRSDEHPSSIPSCAGELSVLRRRLPPPPALACVLDRWITIQWIRLDLTRVNRGQIPVNQADLQWC